MKKRNTCVYRLGMIEDNAGASYKSESDGIVSPDSICHYETSEDITQSRIQSISWTLAQGHKSKQTEVKTCVQVFARRTLRNTLFTLYMTRILC